MSVFFETKKKTKHDFDVVLIITCTPNRSWHAKGINWWVNWILCICKFLCLIYSFVLLFYKGFFSTPKPVHDKLWYYSVRLPLNISLFAFLVYFTVLLTPNELLMHVIRQIAMKWAHRNAVETILTLENAVLIIACTPNLRCHAQGINWWVDWMTSLPFFYSSLHHAENSS